MGPKALGSYPLTVIPSYVSGKGLGGSSAINGMVWNKPSKFDIDGMLRTPDVGLLTDANSAIAFERLGNPGWNWERFDAALKRVEG